MNTFYDPNADGSDQALNELESKHAVRVLRLKAGDRIRIINGLGDVYIAEINHPHQKKCTYTVVETKSYDADPVRHIAIAPTKNNDRFEWFLEKGTEMGVTDITPLLCDHSERKVIKPERLEKVIVAATKQSLRAHKPTLHPLTKYSDFIANIELKNRFIAHCEEGEKVNLGTFPKSEGFVALIGPEGDFSKTEIEAARTKGFAPLSLGPHRLRTETAGIMTVAITLSLES